MNFTVVSSLAWSISVLATAAMAQEAHPARIQGKVLRAGQDIREAPDAKVKINRADSSFKKSSGETLDSTATYQLRGVLMPTGVGETVQVEISADLDDHVVLPEDVAVVSLSTSRLRAQAPRILLREKGNASRFVLDKCRTHMQSMIISSNPPPAAIGEVSTCFDRAWSISDKNSAPTEQADFYERYGYHKECMEYFNDWYVYLDTKPNPDATTANEKDRALTRRITCSRKYLEASKKSGTSAWSHTQHATIYFDALNKFSGVKAKNDAIAIYNDIFYEVTDYTSCLKGYDLYKPQPDTSLEQQVQVSKKAVDCAKRKAESSSEHSDYRHLIERCNTAILLDNEAARRARREARSRDRAQIFNNWFDGLLFIAKANTDVNKFAHAVVTDAALMSEWRRYYTLLSKKTVPTEKTKIVAAVNRFRSQQLTQ